MEDLNLDSAVQPAIMLIDNGEDMKGLELCREVKGRVNFVNTRVIVTTSIHDKSMVLDAGADLYLPKPYEISDLIRWIEYFMK